MSEELNSLDDLGDLDDLDGLDVTEEETSKEKEEGVVTRDEEILAEGLEDMPFEEEEDIVLGIDIPIADRIIGGPLPSRAHKRPTDLPKFSLVVFGEKGTGKTLAAMGFPGTRISFDLEGSASRLIYHSPHFSDVARKNMALFDFFTGYPDVKKYANRLGVDFREQMSEAFDLISEMKVKPDWIIFDGARRWIEHLSHAARQSYGVTSTALQVPWPIWTLRNSFAGEHFSRAMRLARCGVIVCSHYKIETIKVIDKKTNEEREEDKKEPMWSVRLKEESDIVCYTDRQIDQVLEEVNFYGAVPTNKVTGATTAKMDLSDNPRGLFEFIRDGKVRFTIDD